MIGGIPDEHVPKLRSELARLGVAVTGHPEAHDTFFDDPHGPDISDGKFLIELGYPVPAPVTFEGDCYFALTGAYRFIALSHEWPPFIFPWQELRDEAGEGGLTRTLKERDVHLQLKAIGNDRNVMECRVEVE